MRTYIHACIHMCIHARRPRSALSILTFKDEPVQNDAPIYLKYYRNFGKKSTLGCTCGQKNNPKVWPVRPQPACMCGQKCFFRPEIFISKTLPKLVPSVDQYWYQYWRVLCTGTSTSRYQYLTTGTTKVSTWSNGAACTQLFPRKLRNATWACKINFKFFNRCRTLSELE